ncbi:hypothetical protein EYF80_007632 [Liparis tanakae]|uniref:Uncharacterized protein n=1 Tax=Liparis tanakae TaxID=230148 RepID=A0A4Z2IVS4_9TELE|nr:hypothetical protein EYF80_007632 [Liparis tanakae]
MQSRQSRSFSHFSTASPGAYRIDSWRETSWRERAVDRKMNSAIHQHTHRLRVLKRLLQILQLLLSWRQTFFLKGQEDREGLTLPDEAWALLGKLLMAP